MALEIVLLTHQFRCGTQAQNKLNTYRQTAKLIKSFYSAKLRSRTLGNSLLISECPRIYRLITLEFQDIHDITIILSR